MTVQGDQDTKLSHVKLVLLTSLSHAILKIWMNVDYHIRGISYFVKLISRSMPNTTCFFVKLVYQAFYYQCLHLQNISDFLVVFHFQYCQTMKLCLSY